MVGHILQAVSDRFNQQGYQMYKRIEDLIFKASGGEKYHEEFKFVTEFNDSDLPMYLLETQLTLLHHIFNPQQPPNLSLSDIIHALNSMMLPEQVSVFHCCCYSAAQMQLDKRGQATRERS